ncbi:MAG: Holliday junction resolvase RecU, partial [Salinivirgaceae bacterium]|nr:Holliday junction resolvase RecU [Salinivirgaceae bacterium]
PIRDYTGKIVTAKVEHKAAVDFLGVYKGIPIAFDAKHTKDKRISFRTYGNSLYHNPGFSDIIPTRDSCYIVCGAYTYGEIGGGYYPYDAWILKIDNNGNTVWDRKHRDSIVYDVISNDFYGFYRGVVEKDNGDLLAVCSTYSDEDSVFIGQGFRIRCLDSLGNKKWDKVITRVGNQGGPLWPQSILLTLDNGIAVGGWGEIHFWNEQNQWVSEQRIFLVKTDSLGNDTIISDISPVESKPITEFKLECYPNPASSEFFVELPQGIDDDVLEVYSTTGSLVWQQNVGVGTNSVGIFGLEPGMYLVRLKKSGLYGKFVKE